MSVIVDGSNGLIFNDASTQTTAATGFGFKNRIINGAMVIDQRNAGASVTIPAINPQYTLDRWAIQSSQASKISIQQNAGAVTPPTGFTKYLGNKEGRTLFCFPFGNVIQCDLHTFGTVCVNLELPLVVKKTMANI